MIVRPVEIDRCYGIKSVWNKTKVIRLLRQLSLLQIMIDQEQLENVKYFNYLGNMVTSDTRYTFCN